MPYTEPVPAPAPVQEPEPQATSYYNPAETAPAPEPTPVAEPAPEKIDTVEFAIAPHPEEPEETAPAASRNPSRNMRTTRKKRNIAAISPWAA